jgi:hypothetical protein
LLALALSDEEEPPQLSRREQIRIRRLELIDEEQKLRAKLIESMGQRNPQTPWEVFEQQEQQIRAELKQNLDEQQQLREELINGMQPIIERNFQPVDQMPKEDVPEGEAKQDTL